MKQYKHHQCHHILLFSLRGWSSLREPVPRQPKPFALVQIVFLRSVPDLLPMPVGFFFSSSHHPLALVLTLLVTFCSSWTIAADQYQLESYICCDSRSYHGCVILLFFLSTLQRLSYSLRATAFEAPENLYLLTSALSECFPQFLDLQTTGFPPTEASSLPRIPHNASHILSTTVGSGS